MNDYSKGRNRIKRFFTRNGVYLVLAFGLLALTAVIIAGVTERLSKPEEEESLNAQQQVEQKVTGEVDTRTTTTALTTTTTAQQITTSTVAEEAPHLYLLPLTNTVQKSFSADGPIFCETMQDWRLHMGTDFAGEEGQSVKAVTRGTVITVRNDPLWGGVIEIDHGVGVITCYCGVQSVVKKGDEVEMGQVIGHLQTIPCECAQSAHLHLEMLVDGQPIDPVAAIALDVRYAETTE